MMIQVYPVKYGIPWVAGRCRLAEQRLHGVPPGRAAEQGDTHWDAQHDQRQPPPVHRVDAPA